MTASDNPKQQIAQLIRDHSRIALVTHQKPDADAIGSLLAVLAVLKKLGKDVTALCVDPVPEYLQFLPGASEVKQEYEGSGSLRIEVDASQAPIGALRYEQEDGKLVIMLDPKSDTQPLRPDQARVKGGGSDWQLLIALDVNQPELIGEVGLGQYGERPVVVVDHHPTNQRFGTFSWIDPSAASTSAMVLSLIESIDASLLDPGIATCLHAGLVGDTGGFQNTNTNTKALSLAAQLISAGADHTQVVSRLMNPSQEAKTLRLWGHALSSLREEPQLGFAWAQLSYADLAEEGKPERWGSSTLMNSLLRYVREARVVLLLSEPERGEVWGSLRLNGAEGPDLTKLAERFGGGGHPAAAGFKLTGVSLDEAIERVLPQLRSYLQTGSFSEAQDQPRPQEPPRPVEAARPQGETFNHVQSERKLPVSPFDELPASERERVVPKQPEGEIGVWREDA